MNFLDLVNHLNETISLLEEAARAAVNLRDDQETLKRDRNAFEQEQTVFARHSEQAANGQAAFTEQVRQHAVAVEAFHRKARAAEDRFLELAQKEAELATIEQRIKQLNEQEEAIKKRHADLLASLPSVEEFEKRELLLQKREAADHKRKELLDARELKIQQRESYLDRLHNM